MGILDTLNPELTVFSKILTVNKRKHYFSDSKTADSYKHIHVEQFYRFYF